MKLPAVLSVVIGTLLLACSSVTPVPAEPTPNIDATVVAGIQGTQEARAAQERAIEATVEARIEEKMVSLPTSALSPTRTQPPQPTNTPTIVPTLTRYPTPTLAPTPAPTATATPNRVAPISFFPTTGFPGSEIQIAGSGFTPNAFIEAGSNDCDISGISLAGKCALGTHTRTTVNSSGEFVVLFTVPTGVVSNPSDIPLELRVTDSGGSYGYCPCFNLSATPVPASTSYVLVVEANTREEVTFKINDTVTSQTIQGLFNQAPEITKLNLSIEDEHQGVNDFEQITGGIDGSNGGTGQPQIIIGTASINGQPAPQGTVVTAWQNGGKDLVGATIVINEPDEYTGDLGTTLGPLGENLINVVGFDNKERKWTFYDPRPSFIDTSSIQTLNDDTPYYVTVAADQDVVLNGSSLRLYRGLNIIPWGSYAGVGRLLISPYDGLSSYLGENLVRVWRFDNSIQAWSFFDPRPAFADANTLRILNNDDVIWVFVSEDVDTIVNGTSLELFGFSSRTTYEYGSNLIIWRHGPTSSTQTPTPTRKPPTPTPRPTASPEPPRATSFGNGTWVIGSNIQPGTYRSSETGNGCYWQRLSGFSGEFDDIIANELTDAISVVEISPTDAGFSTERCGTWTEATSAITSSLSSPFGEGVFVVGLDIGPGTWTSPGGDSCYWARLSGFSGDLKHIEANGLGGSNNILTIKSTDKGFESSNCGSWTKAG